LLGADIYIQEIRLETAVLFLASMYFVQLLVFFLLGQQDEAVNDRQHSLSKAHLGMSMLALEIKLYILEWIRSLYICWDERTIICKMCKANAIRFGTMPATVKMIQYSW